MASRARASLGDLGRASHERRVRAIMEGAAAIRSGAAGILSANGEDLAGAREAGRDDAYLDRLRLTPDRVAGMVSTMMEVAGQADPLDRILEERRPPNGLVIQKHAVPLGVIGIIFEARPNVVADAGSLCVKSGNAVLLRPGSDSLASARAIAARLGEGLVAAGLPPSSIQLVPDGDRALVGSMLRATGQIDVIIPRGGKSLVRRVMEESRTPVLAHLEGNNHSYIHDSADPDMAMRVVVNAKLRRTSVCGATETLLIDSVIAGRILADIADVLVRGGCSLRACPLAMALIGQAKPAEEADWETEFLAPVLAIRVTDGIDDAMDHIARYGSGHTEAIIAEDSEAAARFLSEVDAAIVIHNASTQFADGGEFGMGAEIGIATGRLHARGPVGAEQLTTMQYRVFGHGEIRP